jgi:protein-tyrosine phosphatase
MTGGSIREPSSPFSILVVCTGNICRSPLAEQLLIAQLSALGLNLLVRSAGTSAHAGATMPPQAAAVSRRYGGRPEHHHANSLTADLVADADLVLTATRDHSHAVVQLHPRAVRFTYTLAQFARLIDVLALAPAGAPLDLQRIRFGAGRNHCRSDSLSTPDAGERGGGDSRFHPSAEQSGYR